MHTVDATRTVLKVTEKTLSVRKPAGRNSSMLRANGFITKEYLHEFKDETILNRSWERLQTQCNPSKLQASEV